jgi:hypothetical protein
MLLPSIALIVQLGEIREFVLMGYLAALVLFIFCSLFFIVVTNPGIIPQIVRK